MCLRLKKCPCSVFCLLAGSSDLKEKAIVSASNLWFIETNRVSMNTVKRHWNWNSEHKVVANTDPEQKVIFQWGATLEQAEDLFADQEWASWTCAEFGYLSDFTQIPSPDPFSCKWSPVPFISANKRTRKLNICNLQHRISCKWQDYFVQYHVLCDLRCLAVITVDTDENRKGLCNIIARPPPRATLCGQGLTQTTKLNSHAAIALQFCAGGASQNTIAIEVRNIQLTWSNWWCILPGVWPFVVLSGQGRFPRGYIASGVHNLPTSISSLFFTLFMMPVTICLMSSCTSSIDLLASIVWQKDGCKNDLLKEHFALCDVMGCRNMTCLNLWRSSPSSLVPPTACSSQQPAPGNPCDRIFHPQTRVFSQPLLHLASDTTQRLASEVQLQDFCTIPSPYPVQKLDSVTLNADLFRSQLLCIVEKWVKLPR